MNHKWLTMAIVFLAVCGLTSEVTHAQDLDCGEVSAMAAMATARSSLALTKWKAKAGDSYRAKIVFTFRLFELHSANRSAAYAALDLIPANQDLEKVWHTYGDSFCQTETFNEMNVLDRFGSRLPHDLALAVVLVPDRMSAYVSYGVTSIRDQHSDYAEQMEAVCRTKHKEFADAVEKLPAKDRNWFESTVFNSNICSAIAHPEAE